MATPKPTQKPVPSNDIKDLLFNSGLLDTWATSVEREYIDRFGSRHLTAAGMEWIFTTLVEKFNIDADNAIKAAGYILLDSFQQGAKLPYNEITLRNQALRDERTGEYFRWNGALPKPVPPGSTPESTGGISSGAWVGVVDAALRSELTTFDVLPSEISARVASSSRCFAEFGVKGLGLSDDYAGLQAAIDWAGSKKGRRVFGRPGDKYRITKGLVLRWDNKFGDKRSSCILDFSGTELVPAFHNDVALKVSRNYATVINPDVVNYDGFLNVTPYALAPEDEESMTDRVSQMHCIFNEPRASQCYGFMRFRPGPTVDGKDSGSFYHSIYNPRIENCDTGFHFARCLTGGVLTTRVNIYSPVHIGGHCAWDIEAADSLVIYGGSAEFINKPGIHAGNPTIKVHKPVASDRLESTIITFLGFYGEGGTTPFDLSARTSQCSFPGSTFYGYENEGINNTYPLQTAFMNEGAVVARAGASSDSNPMLAARRDVGPNQGQAHLIYRNVAKYAGEFYSDSGFTFSSIINKLPAIDMQQKTSNSQVLGTSLARVEISGNPTSGDINLYNVGELGSRGFTFGGVSHVSAAGDNQVRLGTPALRWSVIHAATGTINTSDERLKTRPSEITDEVLDAWSEVDYVSFQWIDSVITKGDGARYHFGLIAQQVRDIFNKRGLDATKYGLLCYDEWGDHVKVISDDSGKVRKRTARTVLTNGGYSVGRTMRHGNSSLTRFIGQSAITSRTCRR